MIAGQNKTVADYTFAPSLPNKYLKNYLEACDVFTKPEVTAHPNVLFGTGG
jgi:hypothetical protein